MWVGLLVLLGMFVLSVLALRVVFRLPLDRIISYKEFDPPERPPRP